MKSDIEIARETELKPISEIAEGIGISKCDVEPYGNYIAKVPFSLINEDKVKQSKLILATSITSTKAGVGKTTVSCGLALGMAKIGKKAILALREPSLGPCFGMKGGAAGGGYAQVLPMEKINLHFTGDFHAITAANNMISAFLDNYIYQHQKDGFAMKQVLWKRVLDVNDRALRKVTTGMGPYTNGVMQESGFDITPASEIMAILCLSKNLDDLERRINNILLGYTIENQPFFVRDLGVGTAIAVLLKDAINPNLVQTTENTPAFIHGGPFANIAHGCNSVIATKTAMTHGDYVITEAGFGADLGAEKFFDIKCRVSGLQPSLTVLVTTLQALKMHGDVPETDIKLPNIEGVKKGLENMDKHIHNLHCFGQTVLVCMNKHAEDTDDEIALVKEFCDKNNVPFALNNAYCEGGNGSIDFAKLVVDTIDNQPSKELQFMYTDEQPLQDKIEAVATKIYGASRVNFSDAALNKLNMAEKLGYRKVPVCIAKTQYSFSQDPKAYNVLSGFTFDIQDVVINAGAEMIVAVAGSIIRMPGLPKNPQALHIKLVNGEIEGLN